MTELATRTRRILQQPGFAGLLGSSFALGLGFSFVSPFLVLWGTHEIGMRPSRFALFMTLTSLSGIVVATTLARWSDTHVPRKIMLLLGGTCGVLGYVGYALLRDPRVLLSVGVTALAVAAVNFSQIFAYAREKFFTSDIPGVPPGFLVSVVRVCFSLAWVAGPSVGAWMKVEFGFRGMFLGAATLYAMFTIGIAWFVPLTPPAPHARKAAREPLWRVVTRGDVFALFVAFLLIFAAHTLNVMNLPLVVTEVLGGDGRDVGITFGVGPAAEIPLMLWFGLLAARGHQLALIRGGVAATVIYFLLLPCARAPWHIFPMQILHGVSFAVISNVVIMFFQDLLPGQAGLATAIFTNAANLGNLVGYLSFGALVQPFGNRGMFLVSAAFTVVTLVIVMRYRPRKEQVAMATAA
jgi:SET family sugar efflux transporter-like MFS transporter